MTEQTKTDDSQKPQSDDLQKKIVDLEAQNKLLVKEAMEKKEAIRKLEDERKAQEEKTLKEQNKFKELYEGSQPKLERLNKLEPALTQILDAEVAEIPEDKRDLIPAFAQVEDKVLWIRQAKAKGLFKSEPGTKPPASTVQSKTNTSETSQEFLTYSPNDPRLQNLSMKDYQLWKSHNARAGAALRGWGSSK